MDRANKGKKLKKSVAIVGTGISGLITGLKIAENNYSVSFFEENNCPGGQAGSVKLGPYSIDKFYHHIFSGDKNILKWIDKANISHLLRWNDFNTGIWDGKEFLDFLNMKNFIFDRKIPFLDKILFAQSIVKMVFKLNKNSKDINIEKWLKKNSGILLWEKIWKPLLSGKFGNAFSSVSLNWLSERISDVFFSLSFKGVKAGYFFPDFSVMINSFYQLLKSYESKFYFSTKVKNVIFENNKVTLVTDSGIESFDTVFLCIPLYRCFNFNGIEHIMSPYKNHKSRSASVFTVVSKNGISPFYWLNIGKNGFPFGGIIEHTNFVGKQNYDGNSVIYFSRYTDPKDFSIVSKDKEVQKNLFINGINKIYDGFEKNILYWDIYNEVEAQPVITNDQKLLPNSLIKKHLYWCNGFHCYPRDRGIDALCYNAEKTVNNFFIDRSRRGNGE